MMMQKRRLRRLEGDKDQLRTSFDLVRVYSWLSFQRARALLPPPPAYTLTGPNKIDHHPTK